MSDTEWKIGDVAVTSIGVGTVARVSTSGTLTLLTVKFDPPVLHQCGCGTKHEINTYLCAAERVTHADVSDSQEIGSDS